MEIKIRFGLSLGFLLVCTSSVFAESYLWQDVEPLKDKGTFSTSARTNSIIDETLDSPYQEARLLQLDVLQMASHLGQQHKVSNRAASRQTIEPENRLVVDLPLPDGQLISVSVINSNLLPPELSKKYPQIKMFKVLSDELIVSGKLDITPNGFHAMLQTRQGETIFIDPVSENIYASYHKADQKQDRKNTFSCSLHAKNASEAGTSFSDKPSWSTSSLVSNLRTQKSLFNYRIAIAATGEYTEKHGGTVVGALSAIATTLNRVNQIYEQDLGIHLTLVQNNDLLIYTNPSSDPYTGSNSRNILLQNQTNIDELIGVDNYDVGHLFTASGGGLAAIRSTCEGGYKAQGMSGITNPMNDSFNVDYVAHELGHQFGATHTFNGTQGLCSGNTRTAQTAFEPGSGSTIMSYAGYCGQDNLQANSDAMFHIGSIQQIRSFLAEDVNSNCGVHNNITNAPPLVNAGKNYVIPARTPFELSGDATDADNDSLIYSWQQVDAGELSPVNSDRGDNALFRVYPLASSKKRSFPSSENIIYHSNEKGETLPIQQRFLKFKLAVQDGKNATQSDSMSVYVRRTGSRFALNLPRSQYRVGEAYKIKWNVAGTDASPVDCANIDILLSVDGGFHFDQTLGESLPNTGEAWVTIPPTSQHTIHGRFKIRCSDNIFFAISYRSFLINDQNHLERVILADEDMPEDDLDDIELVDSSETPEPTSTESSGSKGGGASGWQLVLLLGLFKVLRRKIVHFNG